MPIGYGFEKPREIIVILHRIPNHGNLNIRAGGVTTIASNTANATAAVMAAGPGRPEAGRFGRFCGSLYYGTTVLHQQGLKPAGWISRSPCTLWLAL
jgi:hypothetical protein